jgi:hypothetical protein
MSSISENSALLAILAELKNGMLDISSRMSALESSKPSAPAAGGAGKAKKEKKARKAKDSDSAEDKPKRAPSAWLNFTNRVRELLRGNGYEAAALGKECQMFCGSLKEENAELTSWSDADILARRVSWTAPEVSKQKAAGKSWRKTPEGSVVSGAAEEADGEAAPAKKARKNPWANLSEEERAERIAKMKAGKAAKKAASEGPLDDEPLGTSAEEAAAAVAKTKAALAKTAPKVEAAAPKTAAAASSAAAAASSSASGEFKPVMLNGERFWVNLATGHAYHRLSDGGQGDWAGIFSKTPKPHIDDTVPEPGAEAEAEGEEELNFDDE